MQKFDLSIPRSALVDDRSTEQQPLAYPQRLLAWGDRHRRWLFAWVFLLYVLGFNGQWRIERDSALYLTIGRNLAEGNGYTFGGQPQHLAFPGLPLLFAGTFKVFHASAVLPDLVLMFAMGLATLGLVYRLFLIHSGRPTAVCMMFGVAGTRLFYRYCFELLTDLPFLLGIMAFLAGYEAIFYGGEHNADTGKQQKTSPTFDWFLLVAGFVVAVIMRPAAWALLLAIVLTIVWITIRRATNSRVRKAHLLLGGAVIAATILFLCLDLRRGDRALPEYEDTLFHSKLSNVSETVREMLVYNIPELCNSALVKALFGCPILPIVNPICSILVIVLCVTLLWHRLLWGLLALLTIAMLLLFKPLDRYLLAVIPLLVFAWWQFLLWAHRSAPKRWANYVFAGLLVFGVSTNFARLSEMVLEQRRPKFLAHYHDGRYSSIYEVAKLVRTHTEPDAVVLVGPKAGRVIAFLAHRNTVKPFNETPPDPELKKVYALIGPAWDDTDTAAATRDDSVTGWVREHEFDLGPQLGQTIMHPTEKFAWELHRVVARPKYAGDMRANSEQPLAMGR